MFVPLLLHWLTFFLLPSWCPSPIFHFPLPIPCILVFSSQPSPHQHVLTLYFPGFSPFMRLVFLTLSICIFWIVILYQLHQDSLLLCRFLPYLIVSSAVWKRPSSSLVPKQIKSYSESPFLRVCILQGTTSVFFQLSGFTLKFFTHLELLLCRVIETDLVSFFHLWTSVSHHPLLKMFSLLLLQCVFLESCQILGSYKYVVLWLGFICLLLHWSTCLFVCCAMLFSVLWLCDIICTWLLGVDCTISSCHSSACYSSFAPDCWVNESTQTLRYSQW